MFNLGDKVKQKDVIYSNLDGVGTVAKVTIADDLIIYGVVFGEDTFNFTFKEFELELAG